ncbi:hypothetical protein B0F90DRAFT_1762518, partial [Multifurca ochricompacta]
MGINIHDNLVKIKVTESVCGFIAICMTLLRLWLRRDRYCLIVQFGAVFMHVEKPSDLSRLNRVAAYYLMAVTFYTNIHDGWKNRPSPQCHLPKQVAICQFVSDVIADLSLILLPLRLIRGITDKRLRWRLVFIFSTSIVTTIVSLAHAAYIITEGGIPVIVSALVEDCMSLTVANVPVVAAASLRHCGGDDDGQRWSSFKFRTRTTRPPGASTHWTAGFGFSRGGVTVGNAAELTSTSLEPMKSTMPAFSVGSLGPEELFVSTKSVGGLDGNNEKKKGQAYGSTGDLHLEDRNVVRIDVLPYPREQPS